MAESQKATPTITVLGSLNIDLVSYVSHHPLPGETMTSSRFAVSPGGKGANQAVACAKLSRSSRPSGSGGEEGKEEDDEDRSADPEATARVRMVGAVGGAGDGYGDLLTTNLRRQGVDASGVLRPAGLKTGIAIIVVDEPTGENRIILSPEANHYLRPEHLSASSAPPPLAGLLAGPARPHLLIMQLEIPLDTVLEALAAARAAAVPVLLNPAPAVPLPADAYEGLEHLVVNETEAFILAGRGVVADEAALETRAGLEAAGREFLRRGVRHVVITLGGRGVYFMAREGAGVRYGLLDAEKATVVDTTAAGDTFVGAYALEVVKGDAFDLEAAVRRANRAAARTVERPGAQVSIPWRDELE